MWHQKPIQGEPVCTVYVPLRAALLRYQPVSRAGAVTCRRHTRCCHLRSVLGRRWGASPIARSSTRHGLGPEARRPRSAALRRPVRRSGQVSQRGRQAPAGRHGSGCGHRIGCMHAAVRRVWSPNYRAGTLSGAASARRRHARRSGVAKIRRASRARALRGFKRSAVRAAERGSCPAAARTSAWA